MRFFILSICGLAAGAAAAPAHKTKHVVHERRLNSPARWEKLGKVHDEAVIPLRIALTQNNLDKAEQYLMDVSHPESPNFGKHWSAKQIADTFAPSQETIDTVKTWLAEAGITARPSQSKNWVAADVTIKQAEDLLRTTYHTYEHDTGKSHIGCDDYSVPDYVSGHVDFITPTLHFDAKVKMPKQKRSISKEETYIATRQVSSFGVEVEPKKAVSIGQPDSGSLPKDGGAILESSATHLTGLDNCDNFITPDCLRALYDIPTEVPVQRNNSYGIVEYSPQAYLQSDLNLFFSNFSSKQVGQSPIFEGIDGGVAQTVNQSFNYNGESDLDLEYAMTLVYPQQVTLYQTGDLIEGASFNNFLDALDESYCTYDGGDDASQDGVYPDPYESDGYQGPEACGGFAATKVISTSYGYNEADLTPAYERRQCNEYMKLGLAGVSILYSSGDYGVAGNGGQCIDPTTGEYNDGTDGLFNPSFPGTCPYVTSVGATQVPVNSTVTRPETAAESVIYSGGGFSNVFAIPSYQSKAVSSYFEHNNIPYGSDRFNNSQTTRGYPDVSANGVNYVIAIDGGFSLVYGTSASSPTFGSVVTLINTQRIWAGKSPLGFLNPALYANPGIMNDITKGGNQGCGTDGFQAVEGWDPVTGLGTPNFGKMAEYLISLS